VENVDGYGWEGIQGRDGCVVYFSFASIQFVGVTRVLA
jgi:hypothetical protein